MTEFVDGHLAEITTIGSPNVCDSRLLFSAIDMDELEQTRLLCRAHMQRASKLAAQLNHVTQQAADQTQAAAAAEAEAQNIAQKAQQECQRLVVMVEKVMSEKNEVESQVIKLKSEVEELREHNSWQENKLQDLTSTGAAARSAKLHGEEIQRVRDSFEKERKRLLNEISSLEDLLHTHASSADVFECQPALQMLTTSSTQTAESLDGANAWRHLCSVLQTRLDDQKDELSSVTERNELLLEQACKRKEELERAIQALQNARDRSSMLSKELDMMQHNKRGMHASSQTDEAMSPETILDSSIKPIAGQLQLELSKISLQSPSLPNTPFYTPPNSPLS